MPRYRPSAIARSLDYIDVQSKGWPVGIPIQVKTAQRLSALGFVESAPCSYIHRIKKPVWAVRLTGQGQAFLKVHRDRQQEKRL